MSTTTVTRKPRHRADMTGHTALVEAQAKLGMIPARQGRHTAPEVTSWTPADGGVLPGAMAAPVRDVWSNDPDRTTRRGLATP